MRVNTKDLLLVRPAGNVDESDRQATDIDLAHISAAHNRQGIESPADKHLSKLEKSCQEVDQSCRIVTS